MKLLSFLIFALLGPNLSASANFPMEKYRKFEAIDSQIDKFHISPKWQRNSSHFYYFNHQTSGVDFFDASHFKSSAFIKHAQMEKIGSLISFDASGYQLFKKIEFTSPNTLEVKNNRIKYTIQLPEITIRSQQPTGEESPRVIVDIKDLSLTPKKEAKSPDGAFFVTSVAGNLSLRLTGSEKVLPIEIPPNFRRRSLDWVVSSVKWLKGSDFFLITNADYTGAPTFDFVKSYAGHTPELRKGLPYVSTKDGFYSKDLFVVDVKARKAQRIETHDGKERYYEIQGKHSDKGIIFSTVDYLYKKRIFYYYELAKPIRYIFTDTSTTYLMDIPISGRTGNLKIYETKDYLHFLSEKSGRTQIYRINIFSGLTKQVTNSAFVIDDILAYDESTETIFYSALGEDSNPYYVHIYKFANGESKRLTELGYNYHKPMTYRVYNGPRDLDSTVLSPTLNLMVSNYSNLNQPSQSTVLDLKTGRKLVLGKTDASTLLGRDWKMPLELRGLAKDDKTELFGIMYFPSDFDPGRTYPLVNFIYGGPQYKQTSWSFVDSKKQFAHQLAELGFVVIQLDARGTPGRGKEFHDYNYQKLGQVEVYEHKYFIEQLIDRYNFIDPERIGVVGSSYGGLQALHFITREPDFFKVAVANAAVADIRDVHAISSIMYMGDPVEQRKSYEASSVHNQIGNLKPDSKLLILHGAQDVNAPLFGMMRLVEKMTTENIHFDLFVDPLTAHSRRPYTWEKMARYLHENLIAKPSQRSHR